MLAPSEAFAAQKQQSQTQTSTSLTQTACSVTNVSGSTAAGTVFASACQGPISGNDTGAQGTAEGSLDAGLFQSLVGSGDWSLGGKSDGGSNTYGFFANNNNSQGSWGFSSPFSGSFALSLKAGTSYSLYLFNNVSNFTTGSFNTIGVALDGSGRAGRGLSHASLFVFKPSQTSGGGGGQPVPEPLTVLGTVMAAGMGYGIKRKKIQAKRG
ncbi:PEP-CTERM sorting domain-containing protein [Leptolyngbya sp. FACHB-16]|nr:PEP-CTERM sorting domain-containing protein [Leptolyngbya sp. FACHB-8]MBD2153199.1 PEP-CTERM sorting domain-containing protein [Leptolyngbya sp. FACHB-16]